MSKPQSDGFNQTRTQIPLGIDFGTTNSAMSVFADSLFGKGPVSCNFPITGGVLYPSMALLDKDDDTVRTGVAAYTHRLTDPENVVLSVKRRLTDGILHKSGSRILSNKDIVECIISDFVNEEKLVDHDFLPSVVTLTVPYYFGETENAIILDAVQKALLSQLNYSSEINLLPEPVAASLACIYKFQEDDEINSKLFFVYDIGGGTLDLTLVRISKDSDKFEYEVLANDGINKFGGDDIDDLLYDYVVECEKLDFSLLDAHERLLNRARLLDVCKDAKHCLTTAESYTFICTNLFGVENGYIEFVLTRDVFNSILEGRQAGSRNMLSELNECIERLYYKANVLPEAVEYVVPVGGTSFVPLFRELVQKIHSRSNELCSSNINDGMVLVANGASIYSAMKCDVLYNTAYHPFGRIGSIDKIKTRVSHSLYLEKYNGKLDLIVEANSVSPAITHKRYYPSKFKSNGELVDLDAVDLFQGKGVSRRNIEFVGSIDFSCCDIYSHGRQLDSIPVEIEFEATDTLVIAYCSISKSDVNGNDIKFKQIINNRQK